MSDESGQQSEAGFPPGSQIGGKYTVVQKLNSGGFGDVYLIEGSESKEKFVVKVPKRGLEKRIIDSIKLEAEFLMELKDPFIVDMVELLYPEENLPCIVLEFMGGGDLHKRIATQRTQMRSFFPRETILRIFAQVCLGIWQLHERDIIHRDLKPMNILLTSDGTAKVADLGLAKVTDSLKSRQTTESTAGTLIYMAPEVLQTGKHVVASDMWALGLILHQLCTLEAHPFKITGKESPIKFFEIIRKGEYKFVSELHGKDLAGLVAQLIKVDPEARLTIDEVLDYPCLQEVARSLKAGSQIEAAESNAVTRLLGGKLEVVIEDEILGVPMMGLVNLRTSACLLKTADCREIIVKGVRAGEAAAISSNASLSYKHLLDCAVCESPQFAQEINCDRDGKKKVVAASCACYTSCAKRLLVLEGKRLLGELDRDIAFPEMRYFGNINALAFVSPGKRRAEIVSYTVADLTNAASHEPKTFVGTESGLPENEEKWIAGVTLKYGKLGVLWKDGTFKMPWKRDGIFQATADGVSKWDAFALIAGNRVVMAGCTGGEQPEQVVKLYSKDLARTSEVRFRAHAAGGEVKAVDRIVASDNGVLILVAGNAVSVLQADKYTLVLQPSLVNLEVGEGKVTFVKDLERGSYLVGSRHRLNRLSLNFAQAD